MYTDVHVYTHVCPHTQRSQIVGLTAWSSVQGAQASNPSTGEAGEDRERTLQGSLAWEVGGWVAWKGQEAAEQGITHTRSSPPSEGHPVPLSSVNPEHELRSQKVLCSRSPISQEQHGKEPSPDSGTTACSTQG